MAEKEHKEMLGRGVKAWNRWRRENPGIRPELSGANIRIKNLSCVNLSGADLSCAMLAGVDLSGADLENADLSGADLMEADLRGALLAGADLGGANLMGADLRKADLTDVILDDAILYRADLEGSACAANALWLMDLMRFADGLMSLDEEGGFAFDDMEGAEICSSFMSTKVGRLRIRLAEPVSIRSGNEILGALNRLYSKVSDQELPGPIIQIGVPGPDDGEEGMEP